MKIAYATLGCPNWTLEQIAEQAHTLGYDGVELRGVAGEHIGPDEPAAERRRIRGLFERHGVAIACIMGYNNFTTADEKEYQGSISSIGKFINLARDIGCPTVRIFGGLLEESAPEAGIQRVIKALRILTVQAEAAGICLAFETHDDWCEGRNLAILLKEITSPAFGICWDVANSFAREPLETTAAAIRGRVKHTHIKDTISREGKTTGCLPGQGSVDLRRAVQLLHADNYRGYLSFEWEKKWEPHLEEPETAFPHYVRFMKEIFRELP